MTKYEFLKILEDGLKDFPKQELEDILYDYKEHFYNGEQEGKTDYDIINELGDPYVIVNQYRSNYIQPNVNNNTSNNNNNNNNNNNKSSTMNKTNEENTASKVLKLIILVLGIIVLGPAFLAGGGGLLSVLLVLISIPFIFSVSGITLLISKLGIHVVGITLPSVISDFPTSVVILLTIGSIAGTILFIILGIYLVKLFIIGIRKLIDLITSKGGK